MKRPPLCGQCRKNPAMPVSLQKARLEDIPDGEYLSLPARLCEDCLEAIGDEAMALSEEE